jgi:hypothetical protein
MVAIDKERIDCIEILLDANVQVNDAAVALILNRLRTQQQPNPEEDPPHPLDPPHPIFRRLVSPLSILLFFSQS